MRFELFLVFIFKKKQTLREKKRWFRGGITLRRPRQVGLYAFKASLVYTVSTRSARATCAILSKREKNKSINDEVLLGLQ